MRPATKPKRRERVLLEEAAGGDACDEQVNIREANQQAGIAVKGGTGKAEDAKL
jgi:hypothetical protein